MSDPASFQSTATSAHPPASAPDPTVNADASQRRLSAAAAAGSAELAHLKVNLKNALRQFPDFPTPGILFEDILPIFANADLHQKLVRALELHVQTNYAQKPDVIVGLEARGFLFGPSLALALGAAFVPVRKKGKLPGPTETASYKKEYGEDFFQIQADAIKSGQKVIIVDDIIATGKWRGASTHDNALRHANDVRLQVVPRQQPVTWSRDSAALCWATFLFSSLISSRAATSSTRPSTRFFRARKSRHRWPMRLFFFGRSRMRPRRPTTSRPGLRLAAYR